MGGERGGKKPKIGQDEYNLSESTKLGRHDALVALKFSPRGLKSMWGMEENKMAQMGVTEKQGVLIAGFIRGKRSGRTQAWIEPKDIFGWNVSYKDIRKKSVHTEKQKRKNQGRHSKDGLKGFLLFFLFTWYVWGHCKSFCSFNFLKSHNFVKSTLHAGKSPQIYKSKRAFFTFLVLN